MKHLYIVCIMNMYIEYLCMYLSYMCVDNSNKHRNRNNKSSLQIQTDAVKNVMHSKLTKNTY